MKEADCDQELREAFKVFDKNGDGKISAEELKEVMGNLGETLTEDEIGQMIMEADTNKDGYVDYEEFCRMMMEK